MGAGRWWWEVSVAYPGKAEANWSDAIIQNDEVMPSSKRLRIFSFFISVSLHSFDDMEQFVKIVIISIFSDFLGSPTYNYNHFFFPGFFS